MASDQQTGTVALVRHDATTGESRAMALPNTPPMLAHLLTCTQCGIGGHLCYIGNQIAGLVCDVCQNIGQVLAVPGVGTVRCPKCGGPPMEHEGA